MKFQRSEHDLVLNGEKKKVTEKWILDRFPLLVVVRKWLRRLQVQIETTGGTDLLFWVAKVSQQYCLVVGGASGARALCGWWMKEFAAAYAIDGICSVCEGHVFVRKSSRFFFSFWSWFLESYTIVGSLKRKNPPPLSIVFIFGSVFDVRRWNFPNFLKRQTLFTFSCQLRLLCWLWYLDWSCFPFLHCCLASYFFSKDTLIHDVFTAHIGQKFCKHNQRRWCPLWMLRVTCRCPHG